MVPPVVSLVEVLLMEIAGVVLVIDDEPGMPSPLRTDPQVLHFCIPLLIVSRLQRILHFVHVLLSILRLTSVVAQFPVCVDFASKGRAKDHFLSFCEFLISPLLFPLLIEDLACTA